MQECRRCLQIARESELVCKSAGLVNRQIRLIESEIHLSSVEFLTQHSNMYSSPSYSPSTALIWELGGCRTSRDCFGTFAASAVDQQAVSMSFNEACLLLRRRSNRKQICLCFSHACKARADCSLIVSSRCTLEVSPQQGNMARLFLYKVLDTAQA